MPLEWGDWGGGGGGVGLGGREGNSSRVCFFNCNCIVFSFIWLPCPIDPQFLLCSFEGICGVLRFCHLGWKWCCTFSPAIVELLSFQHETNVYNEYFFSFYLVNSTNFFPL